MWLDFVLGFCFNGSLSGGVWFIVCVEVFLDKSVNIYFNNDFVILFIVNFNIKGCGGVLVVNGYKNII